MFQSSSSLGKDDKIVRDGLSKVCNVNFDKILSAPLALPLNWVVLDIIRIIINTSRLFSLSFCCERLLTTIFSETFKDVSFRCNIRQKMLQKFFLKILLNFKKCAISSQIIQNGRPGKSLKIKKRKNAQKTPETPPETSNTIPRVKKRPKSQLCAV